MTGDQFFFLDMFVRISTFDMVCASMIPLMDLSFSLWFADILVMLQYMALVLVNRQPPGNNTHIQDELFHDSNGEIPKGFHRNSRERQRCVMRKKVF